MKPINLAEKLGLFDDHWRPRVIAELNDYQVKLAKFDGEFVWHQHDDTDEMFLCISGAFSIEFRDQVVSLRSGEMIVVPKGIEHKPMATSECAVLLLEPRGVVNTGAHDSELTAPQDAWI